MAAVVFARKDKMMELISSEELIDNLLARETDTETGREILLEMRKNLATMNELELGIPIVEVIENLETYQLDRAFAVGFDFESFSILRHKLNTKTARQIPFYENYVGWTTEDLFKKVRDKISELNDLLDEDPPSEHVNLRTRLFNIRKLMNLLLLHLNKSRTKDLFEKIKIKFSRFPEITFSEDVIVDGAFIADFILETESGKNAFLVILDWEWTKESIKRANKLLKLYKNNSNTKNGFIVLAGTFDDEFEKYNEPDNFKKGLIPKDVLPDFIEYFLEIVPLETQSYKPAPEKSVFAAMPFENKYIDTWVNIEAAAIKVGAKAVRVDKLTFSDDINVKIKEQIKHARAIIADLSGSNPNVLYELGFAIGMSKPCVQITSTGVQRLPFDVCHNNTIEYEIGAAALLKSELEERLRTII